MTNVNFRQGLKSQLPTSAPEGDLLFTTDTKELFKGSGDNSPLLSYGSVLYGFADLTTLNTITDAVIGKLYLTDDDNLYHYNGTEFINLGGSIGQLIASNVTFDNSNVSSSVTNVQDALEEIYLAQTTQETDFGKIKLNGLDTLGYLEDKLDTDTLEVKNNKLTAISIEDLILTGAEIQELLRDSTGNIQEQIDLLTKGVVYVGRFSAITDIPNTLDVNGNMVVIDVTGEASELYIYNEENAVWESIGKFEFSETFIGLKDTPANYSSGKFVKSSATGIIFGDVDYSEITNAPDLTELEQSIEDSHTHTNKLVLDKFAEDTDGDLTYEGVKVMTTWGSFE